MTAEIATLLLAVLLAAPLRAQDTPPPAPQPPAEEEPAEEQPPPDGSPPAGFGDRHLGGPAVVEDMPEAPTAPDPLPAASPEALAWLGRNPLLAGLPFRAELHFAPVEVYVEPPVRPDEAHVTRVSWQLGTWARGLEKLFRLRFAEPARRTPRADHELLRLVVVAQPATFDALRAAAGARDVHDALAFWDPGLPAVVVLDADPATDPRGGADLLAPALHAVMHALLDGWADAGRTPPAWLAEGLAERYASHAQTYSDRITSLGVFDGEALGSLAQVSADRTLRIASLRPLEELASITTLAELERRVAGVPVPADVPPLAFARQSALFLAWLDEGDVAQPGRAHDMLIAWLSGRDREPVLPAPPGELEPAFVTWTQELIARRLKLPAESFTLAPETATPEELRPGVLARAADLAVPADMAEVERARALHRASRGDLAGAAARCAELAALPGTPAPLAATLRADERLLGLLQALRHRWLAEHVGKLIEFREGEAVLRTNLLRMDGEQLIVKDKGKERALPQSALLPGVLAAQLIAPGTVLSGADDEARAFAWLLNADAAWKDKTSSRVRKDSGAGAAAVLETRADRDAVLALGRVVAELEALAAGEPPLGATAEAERDAWLARAKAVLAERARPVVAERLPVLRALAAQVLGARFNAAPLKHAGLRARAEPLDGAVRLTWDFSDAAQLQDWVAQHFDRDDMEQWPPLPTEPAPTGLSLEDGWLVTRGSGAWRARLPVAAPFTVDYDLRYDPTPAEAAAAARGEDVPDSKAIEVFALRLCADELGSGLACRWYGSLLALDKRSNRSQMKNSTLPKALIGNDYHVRLEHDGERLRAFVDGREVASVSALKRTRGALLLWHHTERPVALDNLVVQGPLDLAGMTGERDAWVAAQLAAMGG